MPKADTAKHQAIALLQQHSTKKLQLLSSVPQPRSFEDAPSAILRQLFSEKTTT